MITTKSLGIGVGIATGAAGLTGLVGYSTGLFDSNIQISKLLEQENKYTLLLTSGTDNASEWETAWNNYKTANTDKALGKDKWKLEGWKVGGLEQMPANFKSICSQKSQEKIKDKKDPKYQNVIDYCSRPKTLQEVLAKEGIKNLLNTTGEDEAWRTKYATYSTSSNKLPNGVEGTGSDYTKLRDGCKNAIALKTTDNNYQKSYEPFKAWCLAN
ncbi:hypothetical protein A6V39_00830 [Candidatus Mycoplasma haematobovis]|uniref:Uncharacterized protein n=1 Tax=Candidatus Mycoplasma haematobovis TaxID=432608 RepID=A0A1A9QF70_9MOLU|nr:hypothetical protein [Candidatus Mycoplasma haematobovis]OAL10596.1 hypothetical protein A6V39_00830 [Candidatus Mycoplasma haematobovis]